MQFRSYPVWFFITAHTKIYLKGRYLDTEMELNYCQIVYRNEFVSEASNENGEKY